MLFGHDQAWLVATFFTIYIFVTQVVLQNVVVAVLLDKFVQDDPEDQADEADEAGAADVLPVPAPPLPAAQTQVRVEVGQSASTTARGSSSPGLSAADKAVLEEAASLGAHVGLVRTGGASSSSNDYASLRADVDTLLSEQAMIRSHLHVILSRLPPAAAVASTMPPAPRLEA